MFLPIEVFQFAHRPPKLKFGTDTDSETEEAAITLSSELKGVKRAGKEEKEEVEDADEGESEPKVHPIHQHQLHL